MGPVESLGVEEQHANEKSSSQHAAHEPHAERRADSAPRPTLRTLALSAVASLAQENPALNRESLEWRYLTELLKHVPSEKIRWRQSVLAALKEPAREDRPLVQLAGALSCTVAEVMAVELAAAVDEELIVGRVLAFLQAPIGGARPTLSLLASAFADLVEPGRRTLDVLLTGAAIRGGLLVLGGTTALCRSGLCRFLRRLAWRCVAMTECGPELLSAYPPNPRWRCLRPSMKQPCDMPRV